MYNVLWVQLILQYLTLLSLHTITVLPLTIVYCKWRIIDTDHDDHINLGFIIWRWQTPRWCSLSNPGNCTSFYINFRNVDVVVTRRTNQRRISKLHRRNSFFGTDIEF